VRYCGIDVSASAANQQLCTLHERRGTHTQLEAQGDEPVELVATFLDLALSAAPQRSWGAGTSA